MNEFNNIPEEMRQLPNWVLWKLEGIEGRYTKIPYQIKGIKASSTNSETWTTFDKAIEAYSRAEGFSGLGFVLTGTGIAGIDIDNCISDGIISREAQDIIDSCDSYTEKSQSGKGIHIFVRGSIQKAIKRDIEVYSEGRYFAVTGDRTHGSIIEPRQDLLDILHQKYNSDVSKKNEDVEHTSDLDTEQLLKKAFNSKNGNSIRDLYEGRWQALGYESQSEADLALCRHLAFWLSKDVQSIDRAFRKSAMYREKWNREEYRKSTINKAISSCEESYTVQGEEHNFIYTVRGKKKVNTALLANHVRKNCNYLVVRKKGLDADILYWYQNGGYQRVSTNEFKGEIKKYIPDDLRNPSMWEGAFREIITDKSSTSFEKLDCDENYINFRNGLYNINSKRLEKHNSDLLSTIQIKSNCNLLSDEPKEWLKYLEFLTSGDAELKKILQEWMGLTISNIPGHNTKKALALYGPEGNNGKTQYINMLGYLLGNDNIATRDIQQLNKQFAGSDLYGKRALLIDDQSAGDLAESSIFKSITGGGRIPCEFKGRQAFSYLFRGTVTFGCNDLPYVRGDKGSSLFERLLIIPCMNVLREEDRIGNIFETFKSEVEGIIIWALEGLHRLISNNYKITESSTSKDALEEYRERNDSLYKFVNAVYQITKSDNDKILKTEFEREYEEWAKQNRLEAIHRRNIKDRAAKMGIACRKRSSLYYFGIKRRIKV